MCESSDWHIISAYRMCMYVYIYIYCVVLIMGVCDGFDECIYIGL
jgi:hypothetical protein